MSKKPSPRIPVEVDGIQVNFCKNPLCANYGVPASTQKQPRGPSASSRTRDNYRLSRGSKKPVTQLVCLCCDEVFPVKSNLGISEEVRRIGQYLDPSAEAACPNEPCANHAVGISAGKTAYQSFGKTKSGSQRYRCKECLQLFSVGKSTTGHKQPHKNKLIFKLLMNKSPLKRICEVADVRMETVYGKIDFLHRQCLAFAADRERKLLDGKPIRRIYASADRQEYVVNWSRREDKRNVKLTAIGSADNLTGYVFQMNLNYAPLLDADEIEANALAFGDQPMQPAFRKYAHVWLNDDYERNLIKPVSRKTAPTGLNGSIEDTYQVAVSRDDVEASERIPGTRRLPTKGVQIHSEYTMYGHFFHLHKLLGGAEKIRFFLDQDSGIRAACLSAFRSEVTNRFCDAFYVRTNKELTVDEKRRALSNSRREFNASQKAHPDLSEKDVKLLLIKQRMATMTEIGKWKDRWLLHPFPSMSEPEKAICYLTDLGDYDVDHLAWLYNKASMHGIDRFFMQVRRRLSLLERPISTASSARRTWHGYSPYNPAVIVKLLDIFRVYYNYCIVGQDKQTPAMRLGLAKGKVSEEDIIYFQ